LVILHSSSFVILSVHFIFTLISTINWFWIHLWWIIPVKKNFIPLIKMFCKSIICDPKRLQVARPLGQVTLYQYFWFFLLKLFLVAKLWTWVLFWMVI
jgi:hypothetical protein